MTPDSGSLMGRRPLGRLARSLVRPPVESVFPGFLGHGEGWGVQVDQFGELQFEPFGHLYQGIDAEIGFQAGFDLLVVLVGQSGALSESLLGQAARFPELSNPRQQALHSVVGHDRQ